MTPSPAVTVVGSINVDLTIRVSRLPGPGETVGAGTLTREPGGKGANQAVALQRLGASVTLVGAVGEDADGSWACANLERVGVSTAGVVRSSAAATGTAVVLVDDAGENQIVVCPGANDLVSPRGVELWTDPILAQLEIPLDTIVDLASAARGFLAINTAPAQQVPQEVIERTDLFIANAGEYQQIPGLRSARLVAVTDGARGATLLAAGVEIARATSPKVDAVSTVGAGDAFSAALVLGLVRGLSPAAALTAACAAGSDAVTDAAAQPALRHLDNYLRATYEEGSR